MNKAFFFVMILYTIIYVVCEIKLNLILSF